MEMVKVKVWDKEQNKFLEIGDSEGQASPRYYRHLFFTLVGKVDDDGYDYEVDADILLYSGINDKHGEEICAGDIIKYSFKDGEEICTRYMEVIMQNGSFKMREIYRNYWLEKVDGVLRLKKGTLTDHKGETANLYKSNAVYWVEVIGNKYENPQLLSA